MIMATYTLTPYFKKLPMISSDFIYNGDGGLFLIDTIRLFIEQEKTSAFLDQAEAVEQKEIQRQYVDNLIDQNGVLTRVFVKAHGVDYLL